MARLHCEAQPVDRGLVPVAFRQFLYVNHEWRSLSSALSAVSGQSRAAGCVAAGVMRGSPGRRQGGGRGRTVGITTGLYGAGGFGKTTLAQMVCADRRVRRRFGGRVYLVTVGRDVRGAAAVAAKVNDVIKLVAGEDATFTDPQLAGRRLGSLLDAGPRRLLVLDDVWEPEQLAPFTEGGKRCARLVTTRVPELLAGRQRCEWIRCRRSRRGRC